MQTVKTQISLGICPGWSESSLGALIMLLIVSCIGADIIRFLFSVASWLPVPLVYVTGIVAQEVR